MAAYLSQSRRNSSNTFHSATRVRELMLIMSKFYLETIESLSRNQLFKQFFEHCCVKICKNRKVMCP